jgi:hypothetical protein
MITESLAAILARDLRAMRREIEAYENDKDLWKTPPGIANSAGNLALHVAGNLRAFVGAALGATGYERDRPAEFATRDLPRADVLAALDDAVSQVEAGLAAVQDADFDGPYPLVLGSYRLRLGDFLIQLSTHLAFHLGQVDYHRRLVTGASRSIDPVAIPELATAARGADAPQ